MDEIKYVVANPGGNITIFVLTPCEQKDYQEIAHMLLARKELKGEQVGFIKSMGACNKLEMSGREFCGNAGRAFALYCARSQGLTGRQEITIEESGAAEPLCVSVDVETGYTKIKMPLPLSIKSWEEPNLPYTQNAVVVDLDGIVHVILKDVEASAEKFQEIKKAVYDQNKPLALGVMFYDTQADRMVPIVYVDSIQTTYWESSCGSGTVACALAFSQSEQGEGTFSYSIKQPAGMLTATVEKTRQGIAAVYLEGEVIIE